MSEKRLVGILNTKTNFAANPDGTGAVMKDLDPEKAMEYRDGTFEKLINYMIKGRESMTAEEGKHVADMTDDYLKAHDPSKQSIFQIFVYDKDGNQKPKIGGNGSNVIGKDEKIAPYIEERVLEGNSQKYDCIEMVTHLSAMPQSSYKK